jgi:hypothetical protein
LGFGVAGRVRELGDSEYALRWNDLAFFLSRAGSKLRVVFAGLGGIGIELACRTMPTLKLSRGDGWLCGGFPGQLSHLVRQSQGLHLQLCMLISADYLAKGNVAAKDFRKYDRIEC